MGITYPKIMADFSISHNPISLVLIPLDERPVNTRYPQMLAEIGGASLAMPPVEYLGKQRIPADLPRVINWLKAAAKDAAACIVSCDFLCYGNLINARISDDSATDAISRLSVLNEIGQATQVYAFSLITRVANANDCVEEPLYWKTWGTRFYRYSQLRHKAERNAITENETTALAELEIDLPADLKTDWMARRLRNHAVNMALLDLVARERITSLVITSDDTAPFGFPTRERDWLRTWPGLVGSQLFSRVRMYPGADEVGSALVAKFITSQSPRSPLIWIEYAIPGDEEITAPYEDRPVRETVAGQIDACGCKIALSPEEADIILGVATPSPRRTDLRPEFFELDKLERTSSYEKFISKLAEYQSGGRFVALADVAYPNGAAPLLSELLLQNDCPLKAADLAAYGAWNTAGNTLGVVIAQACCLYCSYADADHRAEVQKKFLAHRFLEDYGYQLIVRRQARAEAEALWGRRDPDPESEGEVRTICSFIENSLSLVLSELQEFGIGSGLRIAPGSVRLPWNRTFEVDFELV